MFLQIENSVTIDAKPGDIVCFDSNVFHCSGPNKSNKFRRVYYSQYSVEAITGSANSDAPPLRLAVPSSK